MAILNNASRVFRTGGYSPPQSASSQEEYVEPCAWIGKAVSWSRAERKLLFDIVSSSLMWMMAPSTNVHPHSQSSQSISVWKDKGLAEGLWQMVEQIEMILDPGWLRVEDDTEVIAKDLEQIVGKEILDEVILEFITG